MSKELTKPINHILPVRSRKSGRWKFALSKNRETWRKLNRRQKRKKLDVIVNPRTGESKPQARKDKRERVRKRGKSVKNWHSPKIAEIFLRSYIRIFTKVHFCEHQNLFRCIVANMRSIPKIKLLYLHLWDKCSSLSGGGFLATFFVKSHIYGFL